MLSDLDLSQITKDILIAAIYSGSIIKFDLSTTSSIESANKLNTEAICKAYNKIYKEIADHH